MSMSGQRAAILFATDAISGEKRRCRHFVCSSKEALVLVGFRGERNKDCLKDVRCLSQEQDDSSIEDVPCSQP